MSELVLENYMDVTDKISPSTDEFKTDIILFRAQHIANTVYNKKKPPP